MKGHTLLLPLLFCAVSSEFQPYACISERAVKLKLWKTHKRQWTTDPGELVTAKDPVGANECAQLCENFAFMFFIPLNMSETSNCICFRKKDWHLINDDPMSCTDEKVKLPPLKVVPSDITSKPNSWPNKWCAPDYGFMLSCQKTERTNWCQDLDQHLDSFDYDQDPPKPASLTFPQCMKSSDFKWNETDTIQNYQVNGWKNCSQICRGNNNENKKHFYILQGDNCWCAKENFLVENKGFYENQENCTICDTTETQGKLNTTENFEYHTCGNDVNHHNFTDSLLSVFCGHDDCKKPVEVGQKKFAYFGCVKKNVTEVGSYDQVKSVEECLIRCQTSSTMYIKPNGSDLTCICGDLDLKTNIEDMSLGCTETWSPAIHGPTGSLQILAQDQEGFAQYCWPQVCKQMANHMNFYKDSPGHKLYNSTTTTTETAATRRNCTTLRTSTTTTSTTTTESTTTLPENVTHPLKLCCNEKVDNRGMLWTATCGLHNLTTHCPDPAPGFAVWTCDTTVGEFIPKQVC